MFRVIALILFLTIPLGSFSWGFFAHRTINRLAVFTLPIEMMGFYKQNIERLSSQAVNPDKRRYAVEGEAQRHYIDIDHYGEYPFDSLPRKWKDAVAKYSEDTLQEYGIIPWWIEIMYYRLVKAFKEKDANRIINLSADIGHYIGDAHVPLHTTENYNGQFTNQVGIHGFLETRTPELLYEEFDFFVGKAKYNNSPLNAAWDAVLSSAIAVDSVFKMEKELSASFPSDKKFSFEQKGNSTVQVYSEAYTRAYNKSLDNLVERRMRASILAVGSFWYSAWVDAGQPDLNELVKGTVDPETQKQLQEEEKLYQQGKILGRPDL